MKNTNTQFDYSASLQLLDLLQICRDAQPENAEIQELISALIERRIQPEQVERMASIIADTQGSLSETEAQKGAEVQQLLQELDQESAKLEESLENLQDLVDQQ